MPSIMETVEKLSNLLIEAEEFYPSLKRQRLNKEAIHAELLKMAWLDSSYCNQEDGAYFFNRKDLDRFISDVFSVIVND